jgi:hypothetical protein
MQPITINGVAVEFWIEVVNDLPFFYARVGDHRMCALSDQVLAEQVVQSIEQRHAVSMPQMRGSAKA